MLTAVADWLEDQGITSPISNNRLPHQPNAAISITETPALQLRGGEWGFDYFSFQARVRGPKDNADAARITAHQLDDIMLDEHLLPTTLDSKRVLSAGRVGGGPGYFNTDDQGRTSYLCNYWMKKER